MKCEKCGRLLTHLDVNFFDHEGADYEQQLSFNEYDTDAVEVEVTQNWTGYDLSEEEMAETIYCPHCRQFPFKNPEIQTFDITRVVMFKQSPAREDREGSSLDEYRYGGDTVFRPGDYIVYRNGRRYEIGRIKSLRPDGAFVAYHSGETGAKTPYDLMRPLVNGYVLEKTTLGGDFFKEGKL